jgi:hypothetical protein
MEAIEIVGTIIIIVDESFPFRAQSDTRRDKAKKGRESN